MSEDRSYKDDRSLPERFDALFNGLRRSHGRYVIPPDAKPVEKNKLHDRSWARTVEELVTVQTWRSHLDGVFGLGIVPVRDDGMCEFGAIDVDVYPLDLKALVTRIARLIALPLIVCRTKSGGAHVYAFFSEPVPAKLARARLAEWATLLGFPGVEIFPKQDRLASKGDHGSWINMPYHGGKRSTRYAIKPDGASYTQEEFLDLAEASRMSAQRLTDWSAPEDDSLFKDGPPCLQTLERVGFGDWQNNGMFNIGVFFRKSSPDDWEARTRAANRTLLDPPLPDRDAEGVIKSVGKKNYGYMCKQDPIKSHCQRDVCVLRRHGVGRGAMRSDLPVVRVVPGELPRVIDEAEAALIKSAPDLYRHGPRIVRPMWGTIRTAGGGHDKALRLSEVSAAHMRERFEASACFVKHDRRSNDDIQTGCPKDIAEAYIARDGAWNLPPILGVITAPTLRYDGTVIDKPGYDESTALVFDPVGVAFPPIPDEPTRDDAVQALDVLRDIVSTFPFVGPDDRAVWLSHALTVLLRRSMSVAPMHAYSAPVAGSGKSMLVDLASLIGTGSKAATTSMGRDKFGDAELEKRLVSSMLAADAVVTIDNLEHSLGGDFLCQLMTQSTVKLRPLGRSVNVVIPNTASFSATGNNLIVDGDMTRRTLVAILDPRCERPELREFDRDPLEVVHEQRGRFVAAALTLVRAFIVAGAPRQKPALGGYNDWSRLVRDPLIWLDENDPCNVMERVRANDPKLIKLKAVMEHWRKHFGERPVAVRDVTAVALKARDQRDVDNGGEYFLNADFRDALRNVAAGTREDVSPEKLAAWLKSSARRYVRLSDDTTQRFEPDEKLRNGLNWKLVSDKKEGSE